MQTKPTNDIPNSVTEFVKKNISNYLELAYNDGIVEKKISDYAIASGISGYDYKDGELITNDLYYFPILHNNNIEFMLNVGLNSDGTCSATFGKTFSDELNKLKNNSVKNSIYAAVTINSKLIAVSSSENIILENPTHIKNDDIKVTLTKKIIQSNKVKDVTKKDTIFSVNSKIENSIVYSASSGYSNSLAVPTVLQGAHNWCWAASIAAMINYKEGKSLTAAKVSSDNNVADGATLAQITNAWRVYGYTGTLLGTFTDGSVIDLIDRNIPIQFIGVSSSNTAHSVVITGYGISVSAGTTYRIMDPNYSTTSYSSTGQSPENTYVISGGTKYFYRYSYLPQK